MCMGRKWKRDEEDKFGGCMSYWEVEDELQVFWTSALDGVGGQMHASAGLSPDEKFLVPIE